MFPKSGIKLSNIPLTIGNVFFFLSLIYCVLHRSVNTLFKNEIPIFIGIAYWFVRLILGLIISSNANLSSFVQFFVPLCVYPLVYFIIVRFVNDQDSLCFIIDCIKTSVCFIICYVILQFIFGIGTVTIPGLTVNYSDYLDNPSSWWLDKCNSFSDTAKLVSTYQNGNLFGANLLILCPFVYQTFKSQNKKILFLILAFIAVFLSGSRTMYIAVIIFGLFKFFKVLNLKQKIQKLSLLGVIMLILCSSVVIYLLSSKISYGLIARTLTITDTNVLTSGAGRIEMFTSYIKWLWENNSITYEVFGAYGIKHAGTAYEMFYCSLFVNGGIIGLFITCYSICSMWQFKSSSNVEQKGIDDGFIIWGIAAVSEGAFWLPPTALILWIMLGVHNRLGCLPYRH